MQFKSVKLLLSDEVTNIQIFFCVILNATVHSFLTRYIVAVDSTTNYEAIHEQAL